MSIKASFNRAYELVQVNNRADFTGASPAMLSRRVMWYMNTCTPGVLDIKDTLDAEPLEFLQMAYYSLIGTLPDSSILERWREKQGLSDREFRREVLETLMQMPEVAAKGRKIYNNIYVRRDAGRGKPHQSLKQRILFGGYQIGRKLPLSIKTPLKKLAMKLLMR